MKSHLIARATTATLTIAPLLLVMACGAARPASVGAASPRAGSTAQSASQVASPAANANPTRGTIAISDEIRRACGIADEDAYFAFDSAALLTTDNEPLSAVAKCFSSGPLEGRPLHLVGHADPRGATEYNMTLGQERADTVETYLDRHGVRRSQLEATSRGAMDATGQDEVGWARDRRVDVMLGS